MPLVSVVIPTRNRPQLVLRSVRSALQQSLTDIEVVVVIDGPDAATQEALAAVGDPRLRVVALQESVGGSEARNWGVRESTGTWIALLDDDDEWRADKLQLQLEIAERANSPYVLVFSRMLVRFADTEYVWPRRIPRSGETMSDYLFIRKSIGFGEGFLQTSSFFTSRKMFLEVPFRKGQQRFQDTDWLLRASSHPQAQVQVIDDPLVVYYMNDQQTVSRKSDWEYLYRWSVENRSVFTRRAYSYFIATQCIPRAAKQKESFSTYLRLVKDCVFSGSADLNCLLCCFVFWFFPENVRQNVRDRMARAKRMLRPGQTAAAAGTQ